MRSYNTDIETAALCYLLTITRRDGEIVRVTTWGQDITIGATTWTALHGLRINDIVEYNNGNPSSATFEAVLDVGLISSTDIGAKKYDFATVQIYLTDGKNPLYADLCFTGAIGDTNYTSRAVVTFEARSIFAFPREVFVRTFLPMCDADLFDSRCGLDHTTFLASRTVAAITADNKFTISAALPALAGSLSYNFGTVLFTDGFSANEGFKIGSYNSSTLEVTLYLGIANIISVGDGVDILPGCNKTIADCTDYGNTANFRGFPYYEGAKASSQEL